MASQPLICHECGTLLYLPYPFTTPVNVDNALHLTAEPKIVAGIVCTSHACPSQVSLQETPGIMEDVQMEQPLEQPGGLQTVNPRDIMSVHSRLQQQQHQQQDLEQLQSLQQLEQLEPELEPELEGEVEQLLSNFAQEIDGKPVHQGVNPCRRCYQTGLNCRRGLGSDSCPKCQSCKILCNKSLAGAKPKGRWKNVIVLDYADPVTINASRVRDGPDGGDVLEYHTKWAFKAQRASWEAAENLIDYPWILKKFHHDNPRMPGPADWLVEEKDDEFFYGG